MTAEPVLRVNLPPEICTRHCSSSAVPGHRPETMKAAMSGGMTQQQSSVPPELQLKLAALVLSRAQTEILPRLQRTLTPAAAYEPVVDLLLLA